MILGDFDDRAEARSYLNNLNAESKGGTADSMQVDALKAAPSTKELGCVISCQRQKR